MDHIPAVAFAVPMAIVPSNSVTTLPAFAVPVFEAADRVGAAGRAGATLSMSITNNPDVVAIAALYV